MWFGLWTLRIGARYAQLAMSALVGPTVTEVIGPTLVALTIE